MNAAVLLTYWHLLSHCTILREPSGPATREDPAKRRRSASFERSTARTTRDRIAFWLAELDVRVTPPAATLRRDRAGNRDSRPRVRAAASYRTANAALHRARGLRHPRDAAGDLRFARPRSAPDGPQVARYSRSAETIRGRTNSRCSGASFSDKGAAAAWCPNQRRRRLGTEKKSESRSPTACRRPRGQ